MPESLRQFTRTRHRLRGRRLVSRPHHSHFGTNRPRILTFTARNHCVIICRGLVKAPKDPFMHRAASPHGAGRSSTGKSPHPASQTPISNRNFQSLEIRVSHRKHSPDPKSNRNFRSTKSHTRNTWGRHSCLRNHNSSPPICEPTHSLSDCGSAATALPPTAPHPQRSLAIYQTPPSEPATPSQQGRDPATFDSVSRPSCNPVDNF